MIGNREPEQRNKIFLLGAIAFVVASIVLWWINTVVAMVLLFASMFIIVYTFCSIPLEPPAYQSMSRRQREWSGISDERIDLLERQMRESLEEIVMMEEEEEESGSFAIPVDEVESETSGLQHDIPLEIIDGIGKTYGRRLREVGIENLEDLTMADPTKIRDACNIDLDEATSWIADAVGIYLGAGITSVLELAMSDPNELIQKITLAVEEGRINIPEGHEFTIWSARHWITAADQHIILSPEDIRKWAEDNR